MSMKKWILTGGHVYKLEQGELHLHEAMRLAGILSCDCHVLIRRSEETWSVYWRHKKGSLTSKYACTEFLDSGR